MPRFAYRAIDRAGRRVHGAEDASAPTALTRELESRGLFVVDVQEGAPPVAPRGGSATRLGVLVLLLFVLPRFAELLTGAGGQLPQSTQLVLATAAGARRWWPAFLIVPVGGLVLAAWTRRHAARADSCWSVSFHRSVDAASPPRPHDRAPVHR